MGCDYRIQGEATIRKSPEIIEAIAELASDVLGEDYVTMTEIEPGTLELSVDYDDITTVHTPGNVGTFLETVGPAVIGCGVFEIETSGDKWTEWIGEEQAIKEAKSRTALLTIKAMARDLLPKDFADCVEYLQERQKSP